MMHVDLMVTVIMKITNTSLNKKGYVWGTYSDGEYDNSYKLIIEAGTWCVET